MQFAAPVVSCEAVVYHYMEQLRSKYSRRVKNLTRKSFHVVILQISKEKAPAPRSGSGAQAWKSIWSISDRNKKSEPVPSGTSSDFFVLVDDIGLDHRFCPVGQNRMDAASF